MQSPARLRLSSSAKLMLLRRLDSRHHWASLDAARFCSRCNKTISGRQIEVIGGTRGHGPLRLQCPTKGCAANPSDWVDPAPFAAAATPRPAGEGSTGSERD